jgi:hypothetical protein
VLSRRIACRGDDWKCRNFMTTHGTLTGTVSQDQFRQEY